MLILPTGNVHIEMDQGNFLGSGIHLLRCPDDIPIDLQEGYAGNILRDPVRRCAVSDERLRNTGAKIVSGLRILTEDVFA